MFRFVIPFNKRPLPKNPLFFLCNMWLNCFSPSLDMSFIVLVRLQLFKWSLLNRTSQSDAHLSVAVDNQKGPKNK